MCSSRCDDTGNRRGCGSCRVNWGSGGCETVVGNGGDRHSDGGWLESALGAHKVCSTPSVYNGKG